MFIPNLKHLIGTKVAIRIFALQTFFLSFYFLSDSCAQTTSANLTFQSLFIFWNEHCWLRGWDADCQLLMQYISFTLWSSGLFFHRQISVMSKAMTRTHWQCLQRAHSARQVDRFLSVAATSLAKADNIFSCSTLFINEFWRVDLSLSNISFTEFLTIGEITHNFLLISSYSLVDFIKHPPR